MTETCRLQNRRFWFSRQLSRLVEFWALPNFSADFGRFRKLPPLTAYIELFALEMIQSGHLAAKLPRFPRQNRQFPAEFGWIFDLERGQLYNIRQSRNFQVFNLDLTFSRVKLTLDFQDCRSRIRRFPDLRPGFSTSKEVDFTTSDKVGILRFKSAILTIFRRFRRNFFKIENFENRFELWVQSAQKR